MNIFEDLIDELKQENLLEETVTETHRAANSELEEAETAAQFAAENDSVESIDAPTAISAEAFAEIIEEPLRGERDFTASEPIANSTEFFRKRATEEVSGLQMVEHIFSGVERQQKKTVPKIYDDLNVKKALHAFLQISGDSDKPEHAAAEFQLMQETEVWYSALSHRDKQISVAHLRRYCETTRPALSSQALVSLAKFYRNSPYSEAVRSKFDLIVTRLFSKESGGEKREITFERDDLMRHLSELYAEWESISVYSNGEEEDESELLLVAFKFEEFMTEADDASSFDELIRNDFFNRLRGFKQGTNERFFAPLVAATAIESNVRIGNRYIALLELEKANGELEKLENKYGFLHDQVISDATSKTLRLVELLKQKNEQAHHEEEPEAEAIEKVTVAVKNEPKKSAAASPPGKIKAAFLGANKWLLAVSAIVVVLSFSVYFFSEYNAPIEKMSQDVRAVNLNNSALNELIRDGRIGNHTFFGIVQPAWENLTREKKEEILKKIIDVGAAQDFKSVHLINPNGKTVGTVAEGVVEVHN